MKTEHAWKLGRSLKEFAETVLVACMSGKPAPRHACGCCDIPETSCPPRCVGEIKWQIARGAIPHASVVVRNVGTVARQFSFSATTLLGVGGAGASLGVQPASALLQPGQSTSVQVELTGSLALAACQDYRAEILIHGSWEQCVTVFCHVVRDPFDAVSVAPAGCTKDRIDWKIGRGVTPEAAITLRNTGSTAQAFSLEATPLVGPGGAGSTLVLTPDSLQLARGTSAVVRVKLQNSVALSPGQAYQSEISIRGAYEQRLALCCFVEPDASGHCEVEQGESPTYKRAHQWHDHFQCTHSCLPG